VDISTETGRKLLATRIQSAIAEAGHDSLAAFARKMGVTRGLVHNYVAGTTLPPLDRLQAIADLCGKPLTWFLLDDPSATTADAESLRSERDALQTNVEALASQLASERERRAAEKDRHDAAMLETVRELCLAYRRLGDTAALLEAAPRLLELARDRGASKAVLEARLSHLAYAPEIAEAMLRRQQATAVVAARTQIVHGAVSMVEMALNQLTERNVVELDPERRAAMISNLLVVLCSESAAAPVVNAGTLYQ
jgi:transcriptional regulator with XRE-family HTH domain